VAYLHQGQYYRPRPFAGQAFGRPMKVGKEEIAGLVAALELYVRRDHAAERRRWEADMRQVADRLAGLPGIRAEYTFPLPNRRPLPCVLVRVDTAVLGRSAADVQRALEGGDPAVALGDAQVDQGILLVYPSNLRAGEAEIVANRLRQLVAQPVGARS
jgi:L-seryl-tRNA(Ser) seleniumtransferase